MSKRGKNNITEVVMPEREPTAHPGTQRKRTVRLLAQSTNSLWLASDDIEWLVTWLADEYSTGGAPLLNPAVAGGELEDNCDVPGVHIDWDCSGAW